MFVVMIDDPADDPGPPRTWVVLVRNILRFYAIYLTLMIALMLVVGLLSDTSGVLALLVMIPLTILMLPGILVAGLIALVLPLGRSGAARAIVTIDFAACAFLGTALATSIVAAVTGVYGLWLAPIIVAAVAGLVAGLRAEPRPTPARPDGRPIRTPLR